MPRYSPLCCGKVTLGVIFDLAVDDGRQMDRRIPQRRHLGQYRRTLNFSTTLILCLTDTISGLGRSVRDAVPLRDLVDGEHCAHLPMVRPRRIRRHTQ